MTKFGSILLASLNCLLKIANIPTQGSYINELTFLAFRFRFGLDVAWRVAFAIRKKDLKMRCRNPLFCVSPHHQQAWIS